MMECLPCISNSNRFDSFVFKLCIMIVHTLKMCTGEAGPEHRAEFCLVLYYDNYFELQSDLGKKIA